jgi:GDP-mannose 4,6 dehydratase
MSQSPQRSALITGATGQDGAYLAELLLSKGYVVHGIERRSSSFNTSRVDHLYHDPHEQGVRFHLHHGDVTDATSLIRIVQETQPDEIYNLAAQSHVQVSFETPEYTAMRMLLVRCGFSRPTAFSAAKGEHAFTRLQPLNSLERLRGSTKGDDPVLFLSPLTLCGRETLRVLDYGELPRSLWSARLEWDYFQS